MKEFVISEVKAETAVLVGLITKDCEAVHPESGRTEPDHLCG